MFIDLKMWSLTQAMAIASRCAVSAEYTIRDSKFHVYLAWEGIREKIQRRLGQAVPIAGGLAVGQCSLGGNFGEIAVIVICPGQLSVRVMNYLWPKVPFKQGIARLLAHEACHVMDQVWWYGYKSPFIWSLTLLIPLHLVAWFTIAVLTVFHFLDRSILWGYTGYLVAVWALYHFDWREVKARRYAREHWQEWEQFVTVEEMNATHVPR